jgi:uncharacterized protein
MGFEWDPKKEKINVRKHGIGFEEAEGVFEDANAIDEYDDAHSSDEEHRFAILGMSSRRLLFVVYTVREDNSIRLISARKANRKQERFYEYAKK